MPESPIGRKIRSLRIEKNITLPSLAEKSKLSKGLLSQIENEEDANPSLETLNKIAKALDVTLAILFEKEAVKAARLIPENMPAGMEEFIKEHQDSNPPLDQNILQAMYVLQQRKGNSLKTKKDWDYLYESIRMNVSKHGK